MNNDIIEIFEKSGRPIVGAGPCSAESEEQVMEVARELAAQGVTFFRAGIWKPRTKPGCFEGIGRVGLQWLRRVREEFALPVATEVATPEHVEQALAADIDILWIGARTTTNPFAVQEIADALRGVDIPVLVKNPVNPDLELWIGALERLNNAGVTRLGTIHRGFSSYGEKIFRNSPQWQIPLELKRRLPQLPMLCDPSHIAGKRELISILCQEALDLNFDGVMVESHCHPECALSDARQQVTPKQLTEILEKLVHRSSQTDADDIARFRTQLDRIDGELMRLIAERMEVSREIGELKKEKGLTVFQPYRYKETVERLAEHSALHCLDNDAVKEIFEVIHSESIRQQLRIVNNLD
ncbi:MAG: bifunctional 3-deoxy-7-phosphoheptulonate synthase/chorismate mutase type II [Bacteroidaceae bacterium]|nr:bifunctional 3-deoxy-7-phosphoheptulonate synthase/chorismate mutase type II [Bacteroidaceae bacterium]